jgi:hypothetical protein
VRVRGVNYDTGMTVDGWSTRSSFDPAVVARELRVIADDLHADAVRVSGDDLDRLAVAARAAVDAGLAVWFSPLAYDLGPDALVDLLAAAASRAAALPGEVVLVLGCEMSLFCAGFVPGDGLQGRIATLTDPGTWASSSRRAELFAGFARAAETQRTIASRARAVFHGPITYAAGLWEQVEWDLFDIVSVDAYRDATNAVGFREVVEAYRRFGKPVAVTEFGCCTYRGAADRGGAGWMIVAPDRSSLTGVHPRDEAEQVRYLHELSAVFDAAGVDAAFWFTFAGYELPRRDDPRRDLDAASYGLVAVLDGERHGAAYPDMAWEPKASFHALAALYGGARTE